MLLPIIHQTQTRQADCLATCAAMVLTYLQIPYRYDRLLRLMRVDEIGTPFRNLLYLATYGVRVQLDESTVDSLQERLNAGLPVIASVHTGYLPSYWKTGTGHAVVVSGFDRNNVFVNDPAFIQAPRAIDWVEFETAWQEQERLCASLHLDPE